MDIPKSNEGRMNTTFDLSERNDMSGTNFNN